VSSDNADKANDNFGSYLPVYNLMDSASEKLLMHNFPTPMPHKTVKCATDKCYLIVKVMKPTFSKFVWQKFWNHRKDFVKLEHVEVLRTVSTTWLSLYSEIKSLFKYFPALEITFLH